MRTALIALAALAAPAASQAESPHAHLPAETSIPFASREISEWKADGDRGLYIRSNGKWYYARTFVSCRRLKSADTLGFETSAGDQLDRYGAIHAQGWRCPLDSLTISAGPPKKVKHDG